MSVVEGFNEPGRSIERLATRSPGLLPNFNLDLALPPYPTTKRPILQKDKFNYNRRIDGQIVWKAGPQKLVNRGNSMPQSRDEPTPQPRRLSFPTQPNPVTPPKLVVGAEIRRSTYNADNPATACLPPVLHTAAMATVDVVRTSRTEPVRSNISNLPGFEMYCFVTDCRSVSIPPTAATTRPRPDIHHTGWEPGCNLAANDPVEQLQPDVDRERPFVGSPPRSAFGPEHDSSRVAVTKSKLSQ